MENVLVQYFTRYTYLYSMLYINVCITLDQLHGYSYLSRAQ